METTRREPEKAMFKTYRQTWQRFGVQKYLYRINSNAIKHTLFDWNHWSLYGHEFNWKFYQFLKANCWIFQMNLVASMCNLHIFVHEYIQWSSWWHDILNKTCWIWLQRRVNITEANISPSKTPISAAFFYTKNWGEAKSKNKPRSEPDLGDSTVVKIITAILTIVQCLLNK